MASFSFPGLVGSGATTFSDDSGRTPLITRVTVTDFSPVELDASFRYNPTWRTFGHISLCCDNTCVLWEYWINFEDRIYNTFDFATFLLEAVGANVITDPDGLLVVDLTLRWQLRNSVVIDVTLET